jgi:hypothetical protein
MFRLQMLVDPCVSVADCLNRLVLKAIAGNETPYAPVRDDDVSERRKNPAGRLVQQTP